MGSAEEVGYCAGMGVEETLAGDRDTLAAPIDLNELGELALNVGEYVEWVQRRCVRLTLGSLTRANAYCILCTLRDGEAGAA